MSLTFLPWVRSANAAAATAPMSGFRSALPLVLAVNGAAVYSAPQDLTLLGPGDAVGFDPAQVIRTDPVPDSTGFESDRYATVEFDHPGLPWLLTPGSPTNGRLAPWLCLVVVDDVNGVVLRAGPRPGSLVLDISADVDATTQLPDPADAWAWAHAQVAGSLDADLQTIDATAGERTLSRLICPRALLPDHRYLACVVPAFEAGRLAGLGQDPGDSAAAWTLTPTMTLPVYYSWQFATGDPGDFLELAGRLTATAGPSVGSATLDLSGSGLEADGVPVTAAMELAGALVAVGSAPIESADSGIRTALAQAISPGPGILPSPCYGAAYTGLSTVTADMAGWAAELNLDPRWRVAAALGAAVVQAEQDDLVAACWNQAGAAADANATLDRARLARATTSALVSGHLTPLDAPTLARVSSPAHAGLLSEDVDGITVQAALGRDDAARPARLSPAFRRLTTHENRMTAVTSPPGGAPADSSLNGRLQMQLLQQLDGEVTVPNRISTRVSRSASQPVPPSASAPDPLARLLVSPSFTTPMASALIGLAPDLMVPGAAAIPTDAVTLLATNPAFIVAFLVGLNGELSRELTWRGFPVDRTGTFFRWFWDYRGQAAASPDLAALDTVNAEAALATLVDVRAQVVLMIRSELLRRYPNTLLYAVPTEPGGTTPVLDDPAMERLPIFSGLLGADLSYFGFDLTPQEALGSNGQPGWFFVLQQQLTQACFGPAPGTPPPGNTSADVAAVSLRPAVRVVLDAARLVGAAT